MPAADAFVEPLPTWQYTHDREAEYLASPIGSRLCDWRRRPQWGPEQAGCAKYPAYLAVKIVNTLPGAGGHVEVTIDHGSSAALSKEWQGVLLDTHDQPTGPWWPVVHIIAGDTAIMDIVVAGQAEFDQLTQGRHVLLRANVQPLKSLRFPYR